MIDSDLKARGITNQATLTAMSAVPREKFIPPSLANQAYADHPLPIGEGQTISQPYIVALMTQAIDPKKTDKVLEIGTGSGYQAAVLSLIVDHVYSIEIVGSLAESARKIFDTLGYVNITSVHADGYKGWPEYAPFDKIIVTAASDAVPTPLEEQLAEGGLLIMPVGGSRYQTLLLGTKTDGKMSYRRVSDVRFVPMTGEAQN